MERQQKLVSTARPPLVGMRVFSVVLLRNFFGMQKLVHKNRRESCIVEHPCFDFGARDRHIEQSPLLAIREALLKEMLRMEKLCYAIGFTKDMINSLLTKKEAIRCNGKIYSEEHRRRFEIKNDIFKIEKCSVDNNKLVLTINRQPIGEWFKEQWEKLRQGLRQSVEESRKSRGFKL